MGEKFSLVQMANLKPDLILAWRDGIRREDIDRASAFGAIVFVVQPRMLDDVPRLLRVVGVLTGLDVNAAVGDYERKLEGLKRANRNKPVVAAFLEIWNRPLTTISGGHFMSEALEVCRGENVFRDLKGTAPRVSWEELYERNPFAIVGAGSAANAEEFRSNWAIRQMLPAVRDDRLVYLEDDSIQRLTPRTVDGIAQLCAALDRLRAQAPATAQRLPAPATPLPQPFGGGPAGSAEERSLPASVYQWPRSPFAQPDPTVPLPTTPTLRASAEGRTPASAPPPVPASIAQPAPTPPAPTSAPPVPAKSPELPARARPSQYGL
jgi:iron complex transport system substrate-binding protein